MMICGDDRWLSLVDSFYAAGLGEQRWEVALQGLADATGSRSAQLTGIRAGSLVAFSTVINIDPAVPKLYVETAAINPRIAAANAAPVLKVMTDWDFITPEAYRRDQFCQEVLQPFDIPFVCLTTLERSDDAFVALAMLRSHREGHITSEQRQIFATIAPHVRSAVRTYNALQGHATTVVTQAMDTLSVPLFVCDRTGKVVTLTGAAEALVRDGSVLELKAGKLHGPRPLDTQMLNDAIDATIVSYQKPAPSASRTVIIRARDPDSAPVVLDVFALPSRCEIPSFAALAPRALVVVRGPRGAGARRATILTATYGLTPSEAEIAEHLAEGKTAAAIATHRGVAVGTVRAQIKTIQSKVGVRRQVELMARLNQL